MNIVVLECCTEFHIFKHKFSIGQKMFTHYEVDHYKLKVFAQEKHELECYSCTMPVFNEVFHSTPTF